MIRHLIFLILVFLGGLMTAQKKAVVLAENSSLKSSSPKSVQVNTESEKIQSKNLLADEQSLRIANTGSINIAANGILTVTNAITNLGDGNNFTVENDGNLIQINNTQNTGSLVAKRTVAGLKNVVGGPVDYVYWGSPVAGQKTKGADGFSPGTPNNYFFDYHESNDQFYETQDLTFVPGKGYAVRAEDGIPSPYTKEYQFKGTPNNGDLSVPILRSVNTGANGTVVHGFNLVGNPYPSNINFDQLFDGNSTLIYKSVWFWTNATFTQYQQGSSYNGNNYAVYNGTGGNAATRSNAVPAAAVKPNGIVKVGQAFMIQKKDLGPGNLLFKNTYGTDKNLRVSTSGTFFSRDVVAKNRFSLHLSAPDHSVNTLLIGYIPGATNDYESDYDAEAFSVSSNLFYSLLNEKRLLIQGKSGEFTPKDRVNIGGNFFQTGNYMISLEDNEGIFETDQNVFLKDQQNGIITNLSLNSYSFSANAGETNARFQIIYEPESILATDDLAKEKIVVYRQSGQFMVKSPKIIERLEVYETSGKLIQTLQPNSKSATLDANSLPNGMYLLRIKTDDGRLTTKKILR